MASGTIIFRDTFSEPSANTNLASHTPDQGTGWTQVNQVGAATIQAKTVSGTALPSSDATSTGQTLTADATYPSADYQVSVKAVAIQSLSDEYHRIYARYSSQALNGYYSVEISGKSVSSDPAIRKGASATTETALVTNDTSFNNTFTVGDTVVFEVVGSDVAAFAGDEIARLYISDSSVTAAGKAALGFGAFWAGTTGDTLAADQEVDEFTVYRVADSNSGWTSPTTTGENNADFTNPSNAYTSNDTDATVTTATTIVRQDYGDFGLNPRGTIAGIEIRMEAGSSSTTPIWTIEIALSKDNGATYPYTKSTTWDWSDPGANTDKTLIFGHARSLWGTSWIPQDFSNETFRVRISVNTDSSSATFQLDYLAVKVFFDPMEYTFNNYQHVDAPNGISVTEKIR